MSEPCVFCEIVTGTAPAVDLVDHGPVVSFRPLGPQTPGHMLFVPKVHLTDATHDPLLTGQVFRVASQHVYRARLGAANIITSVGAAATQTVFHLHVHVVPRGPGDGVPRSWPWTRGHEHFEASDA